MYSAAGHPARVIKNYLQQQGERGVLQSESGGKYFIFQLAHIVCKSDRHKQTEITDNSKWQTQSDQKFLFFYL